MQILNFRSPKRRRKTVPMVSTHAAEFDHRPPNYTGLEFQNLRTKTNYQKLRTKIHRGGDRGPPTPGVRFRRA